MEANNSSSIVKSVDPETTGGELICKRASSYLYVTAGHTVEEIALLFSSDKSLQAIGVTDRENKASGIIKRNNLFSLIGQKYGRELYLKKDIAELAESANRIYYKRSTYSVIEEISVNLRSADNRYFILEDAENRYRGIVSSFDLVLFLSEMMTRELKAAEKVHSAIITGRINSHAERLSASGSTVMAGATGGDFQYIKKLSIERTFVSLCDVSGKGLNAGLISVAVSSMYAAYDFGKGMNGLLQKINSYINNLFSGEIFLTGVFIVINEVTGEAEFYDMGHSMIYILRNNRILRPGTRAQNLPLGVKKEISPEPVIITLESDDLIASYSDGIPEQVNMANESFGEQKLLKMLMKYRNNSLDRIIEIIFDEVKSWRFGQAQGDDMSLLLARYN